MSAVGIAVVYRDQGLIKALDRDDLVYTTYSTP
jgi:hypothetical protein